MATKAVGNAAEFRRREEALEQYKKTGGVVDRANIMTSIASVADPAQQYVLFNLAHKDSYTRSPDGEAWVRWLGVFPSKTAAQEHANAILRRDKGLDTRIFPAGEFFCVRRGKYADVFEEQVVLDSTGAPMVGADGKLVMRTVRSYFDEAGRVAETVHVQKLLKRHAKMRKNQLREVRQNALRRRMGDTSESMEQKLMEDVDEEEAQLKAEAAAAKRKLEDEEAAAALRMNLTGVLAGLDAASIKSVPASKASATTTQAIDEDAKVEEDDAPAADATAVDAPAADATAADAPTDAPAADVPAADAPAADAPTDATAADAPARATMSGVAAFGSVQRIPRKLDVRLQNFLAMAVVDDYVTLEAHERIVDEWCARRDAAYKDAREDLLWSVLEAHGKLRKQGDVVLSFLDSERVDKEFASTWTRAQTRQVEQELSATREAAETAALEAGKSAVDAKAAADWAESTVGRATTPATAAESKAAGLTLESVLPPMHRLVRKWLEKNQPPSGYNVWGEYIGKEASSGNGFLKLKRADVVAKKVAFEPAYKEDEDEDMTPPATDRQLKIWVQQRDMRIELQTWKWAGHSHLPLRKEVLKQWYARPENAPPNLAALPQEEPAVAGFRAFESEPEAQRWVSSIKKVVELKDFDMPVVAMYEWIRLSDRHNDNIPRTYRNEHENDIMASRQEQAARARELELEARTTKRKMNVMTVARNAVETAQVLPSGVTEEEYQAVTAQVRKTEEETAAEIEAARAAELAGKTYKSKKLREQRVKKEEATLVQAGLASQADWDAAVSDAKKAAAASDAPDAPDASEAPEEPSKHKKKKKKAHASAEASAGAGTGASTSADASAGAGTSAGKSKRSKTISTDALLDLDLSTFKSRH
jgi:hypothetical protein